MVTCISMPTSIDLPYLQSLSALELETILKTWPKSKAAEALRLLDSPEREAKRSKEADWARDYMRKKRAVASDLQLPQVLNIERRRACLADFYRFAPTYFPRIFCHPFQATHHQMVDAIHYAATQGGAQAIAGPRADGKTTCAAYAGLWSTMRGDIDFTGFISKNGDEAFSVLDELKTEIRNSDLFGDDFPEVGWVLGNLTTPKTQTVWGRKTNVIWTARTIAFPMLPTDFLRANGWNQDIESCANGGIFSARGWRGGLRGMKIRGRRPQLVIGDDCDNRESSNSETQTKALRDVFERDVAGLGSTRRRAVCVYLGTLINSTCFAAYSTDVERRHIWRGIRIPLVTKFPARLDLWAEYVALRKGRAEDDPLCRVAFRHYFYRQVEMDAGVETTNPHRYSHRTAVDGLPEEISTIQAYYNWVADWGEESALTELQNNPPLDTAAGNLILTASHIRTNCRSGLERGIVPDDTVLLVRGADVKKAGCHHVTIAWNAEAVGSIIDYDFWGFNTTGLKAAACERLILDGLQEWWAAQATGYAQADGTVWDVDLTLIDSGWKEEGWNSQPVTLFCQSVGFGYAMPSKGVPNWRPRLPSKTCVPGPNFAVEWRYGFPLCEVNADQFKIRVHEGFLQPSGQPGSLGLFSPDTNAAGRENSNVHLGYSYQIVAEKWAPLPSGRYIWQPAQGGRHQKANHYLDATALAIAAREVRGLTVIEPRAPQPPVPRPKPKQPRAPRPEARQSGDSWIPRR